MKGNTRRKERERPPEREKPIRKRAGVVVASSVILVVVGGATWLAKHGSEGEHRAMGTPGSKGSVTFNRDIAPIVFANCSGCHRPGQSAPFNLLTYADVRKHAKQVAEVTESRYMPPWLPDAGCAEFVDARRLTMEQIGTVQQWVKDGAAEGVASDLPQLPKWSEGWQLGEPDLVVTMPEPYTLAAEGKDVYRNFVIPIPLPEGRYVRAAEFRPGNWKIVHHAFVKFDTSGDSRKRDEADPGPGFYGIHTPPNARTPAGHFSSWQPGKVVSKGNDGLAWRLEKDTDLVLQMHLRPSGKPETLQSSVGFYFTDKAPTNTPVKTWLSSYAIDIPAGKKDYVVEQSYRMPANASVLGVLPHVHYLGKELEAEATLPDGSKRCLVRIKDWDFNWQGEFYYVRPVFLPKDTVIHMRYTYDNSADNPRNPRHPPQRVQYGLQSTDEMAELWLQLLPENSADLESLRSDIAVRVHESSMEYNRYLLRIDPNDARAAVGLGRSLFFQGRRAEAVEQFQKAVQSQPGYDEPHYYLGLVFRLQRNDGSARAEFETALKLNPDNSKAHGNLGILAMDRGDLESAESHFRSALRLDPRDALAQENLEKILGERARLGKPSKPPVGTPR